MCLLMLGRSLHLWNVPGRGELEPENEIIGGPETRGNEHSDASGVPDSDHQLQTAFRRLRVTTYFTTDARFTKLQSEQELYPPRDKAPISYSVLTYPVWSNLPSSGL